MGFYMDNVDLEKVPEKKKYKHGTFASIIQSDYEERQAIIERNNIRLEEAKAKDMDLEVKMLMLDRVECIMQSLVSAIDRNTLALLEHKEPIYFVINPSNQTSNQIENMIRECNNKYNRNNSLAGFSPIVYCD